MIVVGLDQGYSASRRSSGLLIAELSGTTLRGLAGPHHLSQHDAKVRLPPHSLITWLTPLLWTLLSARSRLIAIAQSSVCSVSGDFRSSASLARPERPWVVNWPRHAPKASRPSRGPRAISHLIGSIHVRPRRRCWEAFPTTAMAVLVDPDRLPVTRRGNRSDLYFECVVASRRGEVGGLTLEPTLAGVTNHDQRMAVTCAVTASWYVLDEYAAVGNATEGYFILPSLKYWHPAWLRELRISLERTPEATYVASNGSLETPSAPHWPDSAHSDRSDFPETAEPTRLVKSDLPEEFEAALEAFNSRSRHRAADVHRRI